MEIGGRPPSRHPWGELDTPYEEIGGEAGVRALVEAFYDTVEADAPGLRAMLPADTSGSRQKLFEFLCGWTGGPPLYVQRHGHPALRMRHAPFPIDGAAADEWMRCMRAALTDTVDSPVLAGFLTERLTVTARHLINRG